MLPPVNTDASRIAAINVCSRPFRAQGPRLEAQRFGERTVIHNYGHGGAGWSLSWGSANEAMRLALATGETRIAVVGCGAIGLTTAVVAQRHGLQVTVYAREFFPRVHSAFATGTWTPDSRVCTAEHATPGFRARWEAWVRESHAQFLRLLDAPGEPVRWQPTWFLSDAPVASLVHSEPGEPAWPDLRNEVTPDLEPPTEFLVAGEHPFPTPHARRTRNLVFDIAAHSRDLMRQFEAGGGRCVQREFASLEDMLALDERAVVNATGFGAKALCNDDALVPVRGQTALLPPQPELRYSVYWLGHNLTMVARGDGVLVQHQAAGDFGNGDTAPDRDAMLQALQRLARLQSQ